MLKLSLNSSVVKLQVEIIFFRIFGTPRTLECTAPKKWKLALIIAFLKPNKIGDDPGNYRPISVLSFKLFERTILARFRAQCGSEDC